MRIKQKIEINTICDDSPGWDSNMDKYCGKVYEFKNGINKCYMYIKGDRTEGWIWHIDWLKNVNFIDKFKNKDFMI